MAITKLNRDIQQNGAVQPAASLRVTVRAESAASPELVLAAAREFSAHFRPGSSWLFGWFLRSALAAIERTSSHDLPISPTTPMQ